MNIESDESKANGGSIFDLSFLVGVWEGEIQDGNRRLREFAECMWALCNQFIELHSATYAENKKLNEARTIYSFDRTKRLYRARKFCMDGSIAEFNGVADAGRRLFTFRRISGENVVPGSEQRETIQLIDPNLVLFVFEDAHGEQPFQMRTALRLARKIASPRLHGEVL